MTEDEKYTGKRRSRCLPFRIDTGSTALFDFYKDI